MNKYFWFAIGLVTGAVATYIAVKDEFERICDEEVESIRETYRKMGASKQKAEENNSKKEEYMSLINSEKYNYNKPVKDTKDEDKQKKSEQKTTESAVKHNVFSDYNNAASDTVEDEDNEEIEDEHLRVRRSGNPNATGGPYTITPELFVQDMKDFDKITLEYYDDGFLVEEITNDIIPDIQSVVGYESLNHFGEYEEDVVYVRNERLETDYEIIRQHCKYSAS